MRTLVLVVLLPLLACGDGPTQPDVDLDGTWRFAFADAWAHYYDWDIRCDVTSVDFTITRTGDLFSGTQVGSGRVTCDMDGWVVVDELVTGETLDGRIAGEEITFRIRSFAGQSTGWVSRTRTFLFGTAEWGISAGETSIRVRAQFTAVRP